MLPSALLFNYLSHLQDPNILAALRVSPETGERCPI